VCLSVRMSQICVLLKWLNVGSCKLRRTIAQELWFSGAENLDKTQTGVTPNGGTKCRWGRLKAGAIAENWRLSTRSVVNLVRSQVGLNQTASTLFVCSTFAVMQRVARICQRQLIFVVTLYCLCLISFCSPRMVATKKKYTTTTYNLQLKMT